MPPLLHLGWIIILSIVSSQAFADEKSARDLWRNLREVHPFHVQMIALSDRDSSDERVLILSEPPPWAQRKQLAEQLKNFFGAQQMLSVQVLRHPIGFDGWVEDVVVRLRQSAKADDVWLRAKLTDLHERFFGTAYKATVTRLPIKPRVAPALAPPSMDVRAVELKAYLMDGKPLLQPGTGGPQTALDTVLQNGQPDTYFSLTGLVVLLLPTDRPIDDYLEAIHRFALDTDAIVGTIRRKGGNRIAIAGRERTTPVSDMPPLRAEDVLRLAAVKDGELGQSYERNKPLAGRLETGLVKGKDWAPIYLSDALNNTEFGSTLNITDQLLKSWSQAGKVEYANFPYPRPSTFPFPEGATSFLKASELTFNWNTEGVGSVTSIGDIDIFCVLRTGSLPVSYFPEGRESGSKEGSLRVRDAEEAAFRYFSGLRDPNLNRVVQMSALYQIFQAFPVTVRRDEIIDRTEPSAENELKKQTAAVLRAIQQHRAAPNEVSFQNAVREFAASQGKTSASEIADLSRRLKSVIGLQIQRTELLLDALDSITTDDVNELVAGALTNRPSLRHIKKAFEIGKSAQNPLQALKEADALPPPERTAVLQALLKLGFSKQLDSIRYILGVVSETEDARAAYVKAASETPVSGFIRTPSIVISWDTSSAAMVGGHNLDGAATRIITESSVLRGAVVVDKGASGVILKIHPDDVASSSEVGRVYERNSNAAASDLKTALESAVRGKQPIRTTQVALKFEPSIRRLELGLSVEQQGDLSLGPLGWRLTANDGAAAKLAGGAAGKYHIEIVRDGSSYIVHSFVPAPPSSVRVLSSAEFPSAFEAIANRAANSNIKLDDGLIVRSNSLSPTEMQLVAKTLAAGGGGKGPRFPGSGATATPEGGRPFWFKFAEREEGELHARRTSDNTTTLRLLGKIKGSTLRAKLDRPFYWSEAKVTEVSPQTRVGTGEFQGLHQATWQLTVPLRKGQPPSLTARITAFFKRRLSDDEFRNFGSALSARAKTTGNEANGLSGFADLKQEVEKLGATRPEAIRFYLNEGAEDLVIARLTPIPVREGG
ncbi:MAG: hypothetical protein JWR80_4764 [Bradyrhizobium sp.]|nr:hypothetical protein [Bradyrhizobium sp.]